MPIDFMYLTDNIEPFCLFGCSSTTTTVNNNVDQKIINSTDLKVIQDNTYQNITNIVNNSAKNCGAAIAQSQSVLNNAKISGDLNLSGVDQSQSASLNFSCVNLTSSQNNIAQEISTAVQNELANKYSVTAMGELGARAESAASTGAFSLGSSSSNSNVNNNYNLTNINTVNKTLSTSINNIVQNNFTTNSMQTCISNVAQSQSVGDNVTVGGNANVHGINQEQTASLISKCIQEDKTLNATLNKIASNMNNVNADGVTVQASAAVSGSGSSSAVSKGLDDLVASIGGVFGSFTNIFVYAIIGIVVIIVIIVVAIIV
ncbi:hypothetical protein BMW23_0253 [Bodo saltans virus]|uniref:Uncharacterized protein n=1 Tax=Bodo saltans virus TaxID=2024608 RepID=A0A2H4UTP8_9VIRU|nr:hypothetical protein QJ851_gp0248 [Bodo saltans virus]ATZ80311.1 hypothetical protein BMW23_0253 [Bodo saltans virus]